MGRHGLWADRRRMRGGPFHRSPLYLLAAVALGVPLARGEGQLQSIRDDVRSPKKSSWFDWGHDDDHHHCHCDDDADPFTEFFGTVGFYLFTSPFWAPHAATGDSFDRCGYFPRCPYGDVPGYMAIEGMSLPAGLPPAVPAGAEAPAVPPPAPTDWAALSTRTWSCRVRAEYADDFSGRSRIGGHLLLSTTSRFGVDAAFDSFQEDLRANRHDALWIGDCNLVFRFAQSEYAQFRAGLGLNWLSDEIDTDLGFNFTYGMDLFPCRPWVVSATLDWGTLGDTGLFHFRTTGGVVVYGLEAYTGYDYYAIGSTRIHGLVGGVRVWF